MEDDEKKQPQPHLHRRQSDEHALESRVYDAAGNPIPMVESYLPPHLHQRAADTRKKPKRGNDADDKKGDDDHDDKDAKGNDDKGEKPKKMSKRKKRFLIIIAVIVGIALIIAAVLYYLHERHFENTDDAFVDGHIAQVSPQVSGRILTLDIVDNQMVEAGQLLAEIDPRDFEVKLEQGKAQHAQAKAQVALHEATLRQNIANVQVAQAERERAHLDLARFTTVNPKAITRQQYDQAVATAKTADGKLSAAQHAVDESRAQIDADKASVAQSQSDIDNAALQLSYTKIIAPFAGRVTKRTVEPGNIVSPGQPLLAIVSPDLWVTANFKETQLTYMHKGQPVDIEVDTYPDVIFHGHVDSFQTGSGAAFSALPAENATGNYVKVVQRVPVKILFDDAGQRDNYRLAPGLSVTPRVTVR